MLMVINALYLQAIIDLLRISVTKETLKEIAYCGWGVWCRGWRILERCIQKHHVNLSPSVFCCLHSHSLKKKTQSKTVRENIYNTHTYMYRQANKRMTWEGFICSVDGLSPSYSHYFPKYPRYAGRVASLGSYFEKSQELNGIFGAIKRRTLWYPGAFLKGSSSLS